MKPLAFSQRALNVALHEYLPPEFFVDPSGATLKNLIVTETSDAIFVTTGQCNSSDRLVVFNRSEGGFFSSIRPTERRQIYDRCVRVALRQFGEPVQINPKWATYHHNSLISIYAYGDGVSDVRIVFDSNPLGRSDVYVAIFSGGPEVLNLADISIDYAPFKAAVEAYDFACKNMARNVENDEGEIDLDDVVPADFSKSLTYSQWYPRYLSDQQLSFIDHEITGPLRLRGAAGTGKTLTMVIKALKTAYDEYDAGRRCRILFTTHSWAGAEQIDQVLRRINERDILGADSGVELDIFPILTLAEDSRDYAAIGRQPLGIDSSDGKRRSLKEISQVLSDFLLSDWIAYKSDCSADFVSRMESSENSRERRLFCWDLLIEFGCVLAAQGILTNSNDQQRYLRIKRLRWMMPLESVVEKQAVFGLWTFFIRALRDKKLIAADQIVSDYLNELGTFYWEAARPTKGYDFIFVDEMHLFNHQERLIFHNLLANPDIAPRVVMAMDPRQSPRETFTEVTEEGAVDLGNIYQQARLPNPDRIDLSQVYRYSPEIEQVIKDINSFAPALDLPADWEMAPPVSNAENGDVPQLFIANDQRETFRVATRLAKELSDAHARDKERVAILCLDEERFQNYLVAYPQIEQQAITITSRDDTEQLRYSGKRYVLSAPEYVAGLQFSSVIIVDANKHLVPDGNYVGLHLRRLLSEMYLGVSRAEKRLFFICSKDAGSVSPIIDKSVKAGHIKVVDAF